MGRNSKGQFVKGTGVKDLIGKRFGRLKVLKKSKKRRGLPLDKVFFNGYLR